MTSAITFVYLEIVCKCLPPYIAMIMVFHQHECNCVTHWRLSCRANAFFLHTLNWYSVLPISVFVSVHR